MIGSKTTPLVLVNHAGLNAWISTMAALCKPASIVICDGSQEEYDKLTDEMVASGMLTRLNAELRPKQLSWLVRTCRMSLVSKSAHSSAPTKKKTLDRPITGWIRQRRRKRSLNYSTAA